MTKATALFATAVLAALSLPPQAASAVTIVPVAGAVRSSVFAGVYLGPGKSDVDQDAWVTVPTDLSVTSVVTDFPTAGGLAAASDKVSATWAASGLSGTASDVQQALLTVPADAQYLALMNSVNAYWWRYQFQAVTDGIFTLTLDADRSISATGDYGTAVFFDSGVYINGTKVSGTFDGNVRTYTVELLAGQEYTAGVRFQGQFDAKEGTGVYNTSETVNWTITDAATGGDGGTGGGGSTGTVPEPATWAMMLLGFAVVGGAMRKRRHGENHRLHLPTGAAPSMS